MSESVKAVEDALDKGTLIGFPLALVFSVFTYIVIWYFNPRFIAPDLIFLASGMWMFPINYYILYHRVTLPLPTWLTFGHPVAFGGIAPNVCAPGMDVLMNDYGDGGCACFPANVEAWFANMADPGGWKSTFRPPHKIWQCLIFAVINILVLWMIVHRHRERQQFREERGQRKKCDHCAGTGFSDIGDIEKQQ